MFYRLSAMGFGTRTAADSFAGFGRALQKICCSLFWLPSWTTTPGRSQGGQEGGRVVRVQVQEDPEKTRPSVAAFPSLEGGV